MLDQHLNYLKSNGGNSFILFFRASPQLFDIFSKLGAPVDEDSIAYYKKICPSFFKNFAKFPSKIDTIFEEFENRVDTDAIDLLKQ